MYVSEDRISQLAREEELNMSSEEDTAAAAVSPPQAYKDTSPARPIMSTTNFNLPGLDSQISLEQSAAAPSSQCSLEQEIFESLSREFAVIYGNAVAQNGNAAAQNCNATVQNDNAAAHNDNAAPQNGNAAAQNGTVGGCHEVSYDGSQELCCESNVQGITSNRCQSETHPDTDNVYPTYNAEMINSVTEDSTVNIEILDNAATRQITASSLVSGSNNNRVRNEENILMSTKHHPQQINTSLGCQASVTHKPSFHFAADATVFNSSVKQNMYVRVLPTNSVSSKSISDPNNLSLGTYPSQSIVSSSFEGLPLSCDSSQERTSAPQETYDHLVADISLPSGVSSSSLYANAHGKDNSCSRNFSASNYLFLRSDWTSREIQAATCLQRWWRIQLALTRLRQINPINQNSVDLRAVTTAALLTALAPCLPLLPLTPTDLRLEKQMQTVRSAVTRCLRVAAQLQQEVDQLDLQIGLLLRNTMTIQDPNAVSSPDVPPVASTCSVAAADVLDPLNCVGGGSTTSSARKASVKREKSEPERRGTLTAATGLKALRKCSHERLQGYQQLFYLLQTEPSYLATLIFALPSSKTTRFVEGVVFSLFNYGANDRDNFLLINLFKTALEEEIRCKVLRISDIVSGEPLVVKMIVSFVRKGPGRAALREILGPHVMQVLNDKQLNLNTNPVEIYQTWLNEIEMDTGHPSGLPYSVSAEEALKHATVVNRLQTTLATLTHFTDSFCTTISASIQKLPYALLYLAGVMRKALTNRFPHIMDKEILKVVGSLIYYRYINSGIVAPDVFDVITVTAGEQLNSRQRRNLATIAKTLQAAATKRGFGSDTPHLCVLNQQLILWHESLRQFFNNCCRVPEPGAVFAVTQYSEAALIHRPQIHITLQELYETHCLVLENRSVLAPDASDPLHAVLDDLPAPDLAAMGDLTGKTEVCLTLASKFAYSEPNPIENSSNTKDAHAKLFDKTKQLVVDVLLCYGFTNESYSAVDWRLVSLQQIACSSTSPAQEQHYALLKTLSENTSDTLHAAKTRLSHNLRRLQTLGLVNPQDGYISLLKAVATDVLSQRQYRTSRSKELSRLSLALGLLQQKELFMQEQRKSYLTYMSTCRANMMRCSRGKSRRGTGAAGALTYSGKKLRDKGVLVDITNFTPSQYSSIAFVFSRLDPLLLEANKKHSKSSKLSFTPVRNEKQASRKQALREEQDNKHNSGQQGDQEIVVNSVMPATGEGGIFTVTVKYRGVVIDTFRISIQVRFFRDVFF